jgi:hypothetical protein
MPAVVDVEPAEDCALCIIGAGYAGLNALNAAAEYLPRGAKVVVVDRGERWGGQWPEQYHFVRLHQPFPQFTAGARQWSIAGSKPHTHLATKGEILSHFDDVVAANCAEKQLELVTLFTYQVDGGQHTVVDSAGKKRVQLVARPLPRGAGDAADGASVLPPVTVTAHRLIKAGGFDVKRKLPLVFAPAAVARRLHSLCPADVGTATWNAQMRCKCARDSTFRFKGRCREPGSWSTGLPF